MQNIDLHFVTIKLETLPKLSCKALDICFKITSTKTFESFWLRESLPMLSDLV